MEEAESRVGGQHLRPHRRSVCRVDGGAVSGGSMAGAESLGHRGGFLIVQIGRMPFHYDVEFFVCRTVLHQCLLLTALMHPIRLMQTVSSD